MKNSLYSICPFFRQSILESCDDAGHTHFWQMHSQKKFDQLFIFLHVSTCKKSVYSISSFIQLRYNEFQSPQTKLATSIFDHAQWKNFWSAFNFYKLYQHAKIEADSSICSGEMVDLKILVSSYTVTILRNLMNQFQENTPTDSRMEGWTDTTSQDPPSYCQGSNKYNQ